VKEQVNVLLINNEDDYEELDRRIQAVLRYFGITEEELDGKFFCLSGYGRPFMIAHSPTRGVVNPSEAVEFMTRYCTEKKIGAVILDPLASIHNVDENDNNAMNEVFNKLRQFAEATDAAIRVVAHTRKINGGKDSEEYAGDTDVSRGAKAVIDAARGAHTVARMSEKTAAKLNIDADLRRRLIRVDNGKLNFDLPDTEAVWLKLESVRLKSGEEDVGVPVPFDLTPYAAAAEKNAERKEALELQMARSDILRALGDDTGVRLADLRIGDLATQWEASSSTVERRVKEAVPEGRASAVLAHSGLGDSSWLWREKEGPHSNAAVVVRRELASAGGEITDEDWEDDAKAGLVSERPSTGGGE
jgi:hypothetical protein